MERQRTNDNPPRRRRGQSCDRDRARAFGAVWHSSRLITAADVIHAWRIPAFGVMKDAVPGFA